MKIVCVKVPGTLTVGLVLLCASVGSAILTTFIDVDLGSIQRGVPVSAHSPQSEGMLLINNENESLSVAISAEVPLKANLRGIGDPIPDVRWIKIDPAEVVIPAHTQALCHVTVTVPGHGAKRGRAYQALIVTRAERMIKKGIQVRGALESRLRFRVNEL
jgi:hypothetical protein